MKLNNEQIKMIVSAIDLKIASTKRQQSLQKDDTVRDVYEKMERDYTELKTAITGQKELNV